MAVFDVEPFRVQKLRARVQTGAPNRTLLPTAPMVRA